MKIHRVLILGAVAVYVLVLSLPAKADHARWVFANSGGVITTATATPTPTPTPTEPVLATVCPTPGATTIFVCNSLTNAPVGWVCPGSDSNNGTSMLTPKLTIQAGVNIASSTSVITVAPGTYNEAVSVTTSGSSVNSPLVIQSYNQAITIPGSTSTPPLTLNATRAAVTQTIYSSPVNEPSSPPKGAVFYVTGSYVQIIGFEISGGVTGLYVGGASVGLAQHHLCALYNYIHDAAGDAIGGTCTDYQYYYGNYATTNGGFATYCGSNISIHDPINFDSASGYHNWMSHNLSINAKNASGCSDGQGFILDDFFNAQHTCGGGTPQYSAATLVDGNLTYGNAGAGYKLFNETTVGLSVLRNNTGYLDSTQVQSGDLVCANCPGQAIIVNNIMVASKQLQSGNTAYDFGFSAATPSYDLSFCYDASGNPLTGNACGLPSGTGMQQGVDPLFKNTATHDFHLTSGTSPALGAGLETGAYGLLASYLDGATPPNPIDLGALGAE